jgi:hypothetical protein
MCSGLRESSRSAAPLHWSNAGREPHIVSEDLRVIDAPAEIDVDLRLLTGRRQELVVDQTRRANRLRDLLCSIHPGLEQRVEVTAKSDLL